MQKDERKDVKETDAHMLMVSIKCWVFLSTQCSSNFMQIDYEFSIIHKYRAEGGGSEANAIIRIWFLKIRKLGIIDTIAMSIMLDGKTSFHWNKCTEISRYINIISLNKPRKGTEEIV